MLAQFWKNEDGAMAIEYGLIAALIGITIIAAVGSIGTSINSSFSSAAASIDAAG